MTHLTISTITLRGITLGIICVFMFSTNSFCQFGLGAMRVNGYQNTTGKLKDNKIVDTLIAELTNSKDTINCILPNSGEDRNKCHVEKGIYKLTVSIDGNQEVVVEGIIIRADSITFVDVLFEPEQDLKFCEKRKRNKKYANQFD
jgi:hypothetical protein